MQWLGRKESSNVEDRRGIGGRGLAVGGGIGTLVIAAIVYLLGGDPSQITQNSPGPSALTEEQRMAEENDRKFVAVVLHDTEEIWSKLFQEMGKSYEIPTLVMFTQSTQSGCGSASSATGPFYCPADEKVYIDLSFFHDLSDRFKAAGDFAQAYVVAHEVGHHVQHLLGISDKVDEMRRRSGESESNALSVKLELQADFLAGVWAHYEQQLKYEMKDVIQPGDIEEALNAASAVGDDRLQEMSQGYVVPDAFTHGTSEQRMYWFKKGYNSGKIDDGNTFNTE